MWLYEKKLEYPVNIRKKDLKMAKYLMAQYGGPDTKRDIVVKGDTLCPVNILENELKNINYISIVHY